MASEFERYRAAFANNQDVSYNELEEYMYKNGYFPIETDNDNTDENILRFTNYKRELWVYCKQNDEHNLCVSKITPVTKKKGEITRTDPFYSYEDLEAVLIYFKNKGQWHHWLTGWLCASLGRRVGDILSLHWSDLFYQNGSFRERMTTLKEEKTGKVVGVRINEFAQKGIAEYCEHNYVDITNCYKENIFTTGTAAFRKALKEAVMETKIKGNISTHSFRKFYANTIYKLHDGDTDNLKIVQSILGHSSEEITRMYIGEIDRKIDRYNVDYANYMLGKYNGEAVELNGSPVVRFKAEDFRNLLSMAFEYGNKNADKFDTFNKMLFFAESKML